MNFAGPTTELFLISDGENAAIDQFDAVNFTVPVMMMVKPDISDALFPPNSLYPLICLKTSIDILDCNFLATHDKFTTSGYDASIQYPVAFGANLEHSLLGGLRGISGFVLDRNFRDSRRSDRKYAAVALPTSAPVGSTISAVALTYAGEVQMAAESNGPIWQRFNPPQLFTNDKGEFSCIAGRKLSFYLGDKKLGTVNCARQVNVMQLVANNETDQKGVQITQLLKTVSQSSVTSTISIPKTTFTNAFNVSIDLTTTDTAAFTSAAAAVATQAGIASPVVPSAAGIPAAIDAALASKASVAFANDMCSLNACRSGARIANSTGQSGTATIGGLVRRLGVGEVATLSLQPSSAGSPSISMVISGAGNGDGSYTWSLTPTPGVNYAVSITSAPAGCILSRNSAFYSGAAIGDINLLCNNPPAQIQAQISGLPGTQTIILAEQSNLDALNVGNGVHTFERGVTSSGTGTYSVSISAGVPIGYTCTMANGSGTVPALATTITAQITCQQSQAALGGTVSSDALTDVTILNGTASAVTVVGVEASGKPFSLGMVPAGKSYEVFASASGMTCRASPTFGIAGTASISIAVSCESPGGSGIGGGSTPTYIVGGTVSGLPPLTDIVLTMTSNDFVANGQSLGALVNGDYQFLQTVSSGSNFSIATTSPDGYTCTVAAPYATGTVISGNVDLPPVDVPIRSGSPDSRLLDGCLG